jgi:hypothetical protein
VDASQAVYVRTDSDATTVVSPRTRVMGKIGDAFSVEGAYSVDIWTGASVDVVTASTPAIKEQRHEIQADAGYQRGDLALGGSYRYSTEPDYESHGGVLRGTLDLLQKNTTIMLTAFGSRDMVGRAGDPWFIESQWSLGGKLALTQVLSKRALGQLSWETTTIQGFQSSPYRWVAIGGQGVCAGSAPFCIPEQAPDERYRHAATAVARLAGPSGMSFGAQYRFYFDSWGLRSHALEPDVAIAVAQHGSLSLRYRYYTQGEADFYRPRYFALDAADYVTRDRKLSALYTHMLGIAYTHDFGLDRSTFSLGLSASGTYFTYLAFVGLEHVRALELTALFGARFDIAGEATSLQPRPHAERILDAVELRQAR